jgi:hypothetical protein
MLVLNPSQSFGCMDPNAADTVCMWHNAPNTHCAHVITKLSRTGMRIDIARHSGRCSVRKPLSTPCLTLPATWGDTRNFVAHMRTAAGLPMGFWMSTGWSVGCFINESPYNIKNSVLYITSLLSLHRAADCATTRDGFVATQQCAQISRVCFMHAQAPVVLTTTAETADNERGVSLFCCLPTHCLAAILGLLDAESLALLGCCCQSSREFCDGQVLWRRLLLKHYGPGTVQELTVDAGEAICPDSSSAAACRMQCIRMLQHCATGASEAPDLG